MAVLMALIGSTYGSLIEVDQIVLLSRARGDTDLVLYSNWEQNFVNIYSQGTLSVGGSVAEEIGELIPGIDNRSRASVFSIIENYGEAIAWTLRTSFFGERTGNAIFMAFTLNEPVSFDLRLGYPGGNGPAANLAGGIFGHGTSGNLDIGNYVFGYLDSWDNRGQVAYGGYVLTMDSTRVPDGGSTLLMLGIGLSGIGFLNLRRQTV